MAGFVRKCPCLRPQIEDDVTTLDYRHCSLADVPSEVFNFERTLEELLTDSNQIRDLPRELFYCHGIRKLSISDNEIINIPPAISSLVNLEELNFSKNGIIDVPDTIKQCKLLSVIDASVNPLGKLPDGFTQLLNLTQLYLNDTFLDYLPGSFGRLTKLKIFEIRENHLKTLPQSFSRLVELQRLDIGNNEFTELPECVGSLVKLSELWCDTNQIKIIPNGIGNLKELMFLDASKNKIHSVPDEIEGCSSLADLHLTANRIQELPESLGNLNNLTTLKIDDNHLTSLPKSIGGLSSVSELNVSTNDLETLPASIGFLRNLRTFYADENLLEELPCELGSCNGLTVLSLRGNKLTYIPDELGRIPKLRVLNLSDNSIKYLPFSIVKLKELQALWLTENQTKPLIPLQSENDGETGRKILTCYLLPQQPDTYQDEKDGDTDSFHPSIWEEERRIRQKIHFEFSDDPEDNERLFRCPTPYPKDLRQKARHARNLVLRQSLSGKREFEGRENYGYESEGGGSTISPTVSREQHTLLSPSLHETHRLYRCDKEKQMKDKARLHHRNATSGNDGEETVLRSPKPKRHVLEGRIHKKGLGEQPSIRKRNQNPTSGPPKQNPSPESNSEPKPVDYNSASWHIEALNYKQLVYHHKGHRGHRGHRGRRMREYDSDTGYRSDQDVIRFRQECLHDNRDSRSLPRSCHYQSRERRDAGYTSDLESYIHRTRSAAYKHISLSQQFPALSVPYDLNGGTQYSGYRTSASSLQGKPSYGGGGVKNYEFVQGKSNSGNRVSDGGSLKNYDYVQSNQVPVKSNYDSSVKNYEFVQGKSNYNSGIKNYDFVPNLVQPFQSNSNSKLDSDLDQSQDNSVCREMPSVLPSPSPSLFQRSRFIDQSTPVCADPSQDGCVSTSSAEENNNAKDWKRGLYTVMEENIARAASNQKLNYSSHSNESAPLPPPYQSAPPYPHPSSKGGDRHNHDPPHSHQSSPRGQRSDANMHLYGDGSRQRETLEKETGYLQRELDDEYHRDRSSSQILDGQYQQERSDSNSLSMDGQYQRERSDSNSLDKHYPRERSDSNTLSMDGQYQQERSNSNSLDKQYQRERSLSNTLEHEYQRERSNSQTLEDKYERDGLNSDTLDSQYRGSTFHRERSDSSTLDPQYHRERSDSPTLDNQYPGTTFPPAPLQPVMTRYEDIVIYKGDPSSQVSSSTDSGYGHSHLPYDRLADLSSKFMSLNTSRQSPSPSSNVTISRNSSSSREYLNSRETTPTDPVPSPSHNKITYVDSSSVDSKHVFQVQITKNPGLGFSIAGGSDSHGNPFRPDDMGIFVTKVQSNGPAKRSIRTGDKILKVNGTDFQNIKHNDAVAFLKTNTTVCLHIERIQKVNLV